MYFKKISKVDGDNKFIVYWDANNLYGWAMNQPLLDCDFEFLTKKDISEFCVDSISENSPIGYIELHNSYSDYPLAPEKIEIS